MSARNAMWSGTNQGGGDFSHKVRGGGRFGRQRHWQANMDSSRGQQRRDYRDRRTFGTAGNDVTSSSWKEGVNGTSVETTSDGKKAIDLALSDDEGETTSLTVNTNYANRYDRWRRLEEVQKIKDKFGTVDDVDEDSSSSEDEDGNRLPPEFDKEFLRALSCLKAKDPRIYDKSAQFFQNLDITNLKDVHVNKPKKSEKPVYLRDYERKMLLTNEQGLPDEEKDNEQLKKELLVESGTYLQEQQQIKESFKKFIADSDDDDDLLSNRKKTDSEQAKDDHDYYMWLKGQKHHLEEKDVEKDIGYLKEMWNKKKLSADEEFLRDFIVDKKYLNHKENENIEDGKFEKQDTSEDEEVIEKMDNFEAKYNFRFEEPDQEFIKRYPRLVTTSLRLKDEKRIQQRKKTKERKIKKKDQKREELKRLKAMKRKEIVEKLEQIRHITGNARLGLEAEDLDGDFDPEAYDRRMAQVFDEQYYDEEQKHGDLENDEVEEEQKPEFPPIDDAFDENWDEWQVGNEEIQQTSNGNQEPHCEDPDFNMDCEYNPKAAFQEEMINASRKKRRKLNKLAKALRRRKPVFDPKNETFEKYFDEYYKLDYEDIIDDLPCRFKYRKVLPNDFGLSVEEILCADDRELNAWCSLKKTCQYRSEQEEKQDFYAYRDKSRSYWKKQKILKSVYEKPEDENTVSEPVSDKSKETEPKSEANQEATKTTKNTKKKKKIAQEWTSASGKQNRKEGKNAMPTKETRKSGNKWKNIDVGISNSRLKAFGINPKKYKNHLKYGKKEGN